jgi:hypothetical protein
MSQIKNRNKKTKGVLRMFSADILVAVSGASLIWGAVWSVAEIIRRAR